MLLSLGSASSHSHKLLMGTKPCSVDVVMYKLNYNELAFSANLRNSFYVL